MAVCWWCVWCDKGTDRMEWSGVDLVKKKERDKETKREKSAKAELSKTKKLYICSSLMEAKKKRKRKKKQATAQPRRRTK